MTLCYRFSIFFGELYASVVKDDLVIYLAFYNSLLSIFSWLFWNFSGLFLFLSCLFWIQSWFLLSSVFIFHQFWNVQQVILIFQQFVLISQLFCFDFSTVCFDFSAISLHFSTICFISQLFVLISQLFVFNTQFSVLFK